MARKKNIQLKFAVTLVFVATIFSSIFTVSAMAFYLDSKGFFDKPSQEDVLLEQKNMDLQMEKAIENFIEKQQKQAIEQQKAKSAPTNIPKTKKPNVELFVMSHCPYGTQIEKGLLPPLYLLDDKVDFELKFVDYAMHPQYELEEQVTQYCIQNKTGKILDYLGCFLEAGKSEECMDRLNIDKALIEDCASAVDSEFKITENYNDKNTWKGNYPPFKTNADDNKKYNVLGSPTLIINGIEVPTARDSASLLQNICLGFENQPQECLKELPQDTPSTGFGFNNDSGALELDCIE